MLGLARAGGGVVAGSANAVGSVTGDVGVVWWNWVAILVSVLLDGIAIRVHCKQQIKTKLEMEWSCCWIC